RARDEGGELLGADAYRDLRTLAESGAGVAVHEGVGVQVAGEGGPAHHQHRDADVGAHAAGPRRVVAKGGTRAEHAVVAPAWRATDHEAHVEVRAWPGPEGVAPHQGALEAALLRDVEAGHDPVAGGQAGADG